MRRVSGLRAALRAFEGFPEPVRRQIAYGLDRAAEGGKADNAKLLHGIYGGIFEIVADDRSGTYRAVYAVKAWCRYLGVACISEEIRAWDQNAAAGNRPDPREDQEVKRGPSMKKKAGENDLVLGSQDVFADLRFGDAPLMLMKARVATEIVRVLDRRSLSGRTAAKVTGATAADISRIRNADLDRFTLDRLVRIAERLGCSLEIKIRKAA